MGSNGTCSIVEWRSGAVPLDWHSGMVSKPMDQRVFQSQENRIPLRKVNVRVVEKHLCLVTEPRIQKEQYVFCPGCGTVGQLFTLTQVSAG